MLLSVASQLRFLTSSAVSAALQHPLPTVVSITCGLLAYYYLKVVSVPELVSKPTSAWTKFLRTHVPLLREKYWCSVWCYEARVQTLAASLLSATAPALQYDREIMSLWDGGQICLDWIINPVRGGPVEPSCSPECSSCPSSDVGSSSGLCGDAVLCNGVLHAPSEGAVSPPEGGATHLESVANVSSEVGAPEQPHDKDNQSQQAASGPVSSNKESIPPNSIPRFPQVAPTEEKNSPGEGALSATDRAFPITETPLLIILPGLTGSSDSEYVKDFVGAGHRAGFKCVIMNNRGKGGVPLKTPRTYCAANCEDFAAAVEHMVGRYQRESAYATAPYARPDPLIVVVGISLGGMILCHYLCEQSAVAKRRLTAAVGVSVPYNVFIGTDNLERPLLNYLLNNHLARCLSRSVEDLAPMLASSDAWNYNEVVKSSTIREFDSRFTAVQFGFRDVNAYYEKACLHDKMHSVTVPYLGLSSEDDPFQPRAGLPLGTARASDHVALCVTSHGGHIGFLEGVRAGSWGARLLLQLLTAVRRNPHLLQEEGAEGAEL